MHHTVRITYYDGDKSPLLLGAVEPLVAELAQLGVTASWVRTHWRFGPHVDLHLACPAERFESAILPLARGRLEAWLAAHPSRTVIDPADYERKSISLGKAEKVAGPYLPLAPNNSVAASAAAAAAQPIMGLVEIGVLRDRFLAGALPLVFDLLRLRREDQGQFHLMLAQMMVCVTAVAVPGGTAIGHLSFRAHAEAFIGAFGQTRDEFDRFSASYRPRLTAQLRTLLEELEGPAQLPQRSPLLQAFTQLLQECLVHARAIVAERYDQIELAGSGADHARRAGAPNVIFDAMKQDHVGSFIKDPGYVPYRILINLFYLLIPILSLTPAQRFCLCHIVADACQEIYGIDWKQVFFSKQSVEG